MIDYLIMCLKVYLVASGAFTAMLLIVCLLHAYRRKGKTSWHNTP